MASAQRVIRSVEAPTEAEARTMAQPVLAAFEAGRWTLEESIWIPGDRRVGLGESLILSPESQLLLEDPGTLRMAFVTDDPNATVPAAEPARREPDVFEDVGGVRYRRLVPRFAVGLIVGAIGLLLFLGFVASSGLMSAGRLSPDANGGCPVGYAPAWTTDDAGKVIDRWCERFP